MIRISILYPYTEGATFDFDYYAQRHFPLVLELLAPFGAERFEIDRGLALAAETQPEWIAQGYLFMRDLAGFQQGIAKHGVEIRADIPNYTNLQPKLYLSEVVE